ncbi:BamA/TamA family outer membrane protein [Ideonella sp. TBM-1]|uniref:BamA/TamA family outer membrane protein n=2 Tax=Ideonella livida TaxID=2707176 RepID=A0A7C9THR1_9BURK|nr:BamA/TamA family outer membrane protein [Ideonella livida]
MVAMQGCALLDGPPQPAAPADGDALPSPAAGASAPASTLPRDAEGRLPRLEIRAPSDLRALLEQHLDLARAMRLPDAASVDPAEWTRLIEAAPAQARELARVLGRFSAQVSVEVGPDMEEPAAPTPAATAPGPSTATASQAVPDTRQAIAVTRVVLKVQAGPKARVRRLALDVQGELGSAADQGDEQAREVRDRLRSSWGLPEGSDFTNAAWGDAKTAVIAQLRAAGYLSATWSGTSAQVETDGRSVRLFLVLDSGPLYRAGDIEVTGLVHHDLAQVRGLAGFTTGQALTEARLIAYQERLQKTGLFDQVSVAVVPAQASAAAAPVQVRLQESTLQSATFSVGYTSNVGPKATVEHRYRRVLGWPLTSRVKLGWAASEQTIDGELSTYLDTRFERRLLGLVVKRETDDAEIVLSQRWRLGLAHDTTADEWLNFIEAERARECDANASGVGFHCEDLNALSLNRHRIWRRVDSVLLPTDGYSAQLQLGAGATDGNDSNPGPFGRLYGRVIGYWPTGRNWYLQGKLEAGQVLRRTGLQVPDSQLFRAGGDDSVRGYAYRSLAPLSDSGTVRGGTVLWTGSLEIARPFTRETPAFWWAAFVDAGRAADHWTDADPAWGYGLGVRWRSPVGPLKLDWAWGQELGHARLHLNIGIAF